MSRPMCAACLQPIVFVPTEASGKPMPLDPEQDSDGNVVLIRDLLGEQRAHVLTKDELARGTYDDLPRWQSHFATCPKLAKALARHARKARARR